MKLSRQWVSRVSSAHLLVAFVTSLMLADPVNAQQSENLVLVGRIDNDPPFNFETNLRGADATIEMTSSQGNCGWSGRLDQKAPDFLKGIVNIAHKSASWCPDSAEVYFETTDASNVDMQFEWSLGKSRSASFLVKMVKSLGQEIDFLSIATERVAGEKLAENVNILRPEEIDQWRHLGLLVALGKDPAELMRYISMPRSGDEFEDRENDKKMYDRLTELGRKISDGFSEMIFLTKSSPVKLGEYNFDRNVYPICVPVRMSVPEATDMVFGLGTTFNWPVETYVSCDDTITKLPNGVSLAYGTALNLKFDDSDQAKRFRDEFLHGGLTVSFSCTQLQVANRNTGLGCSVDAIVLSRKSDNRPIYAKVYYEGTWREYNTFARQP